MLKITKTIVRTNDALKTRIIEDSDVIGQTDKGLVEEHVRLVERQDKTAINGIT